MIYHMKYYESESISHVCVQEIYEKYKSRTEVETVFDMYKNLLQADRSYMQTDAAFVGSVFINRLETMLYYKLLSLIRAKRKSSILSPKDLLMRLSRVFHLRIGQKWVQAEIPLSSKKFFKALDIVVAYFLGS